MHLKIGVLADECSRGAGVVQVNVAQEQVVDVTEGEAVFGETLLERWDARRGAAVVEREAVVGLEQVGGDDALGAPVAEVD